VRQSSCVTFTLCLAIRVDHVVFTPGENSAVRFTIPAAVARSEALAIALDQFSVWQEEVVTRTFGPRNRSSRARVAQRRAAMTLLPLPGGPSMITTSRLASCRARCSSIRCKHSSNPRRCPSRRTNRVEEGSSTARATDSMSLRSCAYSPTSNSTAQVSSAERSRSLRKLGNRFVRSLAEAVNTGYAAASAA